MHFRLFSILPTQAEQALFVICYESLKLYLGNATFQQALAGATSLAQCLKGSMSPIFTEITALCTITLKKCYFSFYQSDVHPLSHWLSEKSFALQVC